MDPRTARAAMLLAPLAVLPLAVVAGLVCRLGLPPLACGLLAVGTLVLGSRALHVDGLSDTADGLTASYDRERSLEVMHTGPSGPAGGAAVFLVLGLQAVGLAGLTGSWLDAVLAGLLVCVSRCALAVTCAAGVPSARPGLGSTYAGVVPRPAALLVWVVAAAVVSVVAAWAGHDWWRGVLAAGVAGLVVVLLVSRAVRRLGGVTGDVYGAAIELSLAALLVTLS